jgi:uncharacterized protein (TIGR02147 family)
MTHNVWGADMNIRATDLLVKELDYRKSSNKKYSLRAFARDLNVSPGFLSQVLKNEKNLSVDNALCFSKKLGWDSHDSQLLVNLVRYQSATSESEKNYVRREIAKANQIYKKFDKLKADQFVAISDWYHFAILELIDVKGFSSNPIWIAKRLNITVSEVTAAIDRLIRLKMIEVDNDGSLLKKKNNAVKDTPSQALRNLHKQHLKKVYNSFENIPYDKRHVSGITMAINPKKLPEAFELINEFRSQMSALLEEGTKENVYQLAVQLFPLDMETKKA